eukprot:TRINITY_DN16845_c0_g1_i1.p1 TRINITY_DN16845_c0_g1~~TRINITY_DN16845_c0_g1_i1.p1  ORF type:complete len:576 (+),score=187.74 TRINITY_DN16845_c0_g1_i1:87-1814(+)
MPTRVLHVFLDGAGDDTAVEWEVDENKPFADRAQMARLCEALGCGDEAMEELEFALHAVKGAQREAIDMAASPFEWMHRSGIDLERLAITKTRREPPSGGESPADDAAGDTTRMQETATTGVPGDATDAGETPRDPVAPVHYEAAERGWVPIRRKTDHGTSYHVPICPAPEAKGGMTHSLCGKCIRALTPVLKDVVWGDVAEHPAALKLNTEYRRGWIGKLSFDRNKRGEWKVKSVGATWKDRYFVIGPNGLHYYSSEAVRSTGQAPANAKNSKIFNADTELVVDPSAAEFSELRKADDTYVYFGLTFRKPDVALLMRVRRQEDKTEWVDFLGTTLNLLKRDEAWANGAKPGMFKDLGSNFLSRITEYRALQQEALATQENELKDAREAELQAAKFKAETEHLNRLTDRAEGDVTKIMDQVRVMLKEHEAMRAEAKRENADALEKLARAQLGAEASEKGLREAQEQHEQSWSRMSQLREQVAALREETEGFKEEKAAIFSRWRKQEERHAPKEKSKHEDPGRLLAFSPAGSPYNPRTLNLVDSGAAAGMLRSPTRKNVYLKSGLSTARVPPPGLL